MTNEQLIKALEPAAEAMSLQDSLLFGELLKRFKELEEESNQLRQSSSILWVKLFSKHRHKRSIAQVHALAYAILSVTRSDYWRA